MTVAPTGLPVEEAVAEVRTALAGAGVAVVQAPPGAGKTTVVPLRLLEEPWLGGRRIVVLEPRRLAARAAARRMAALLGEEVGATVGYRTRDDSAVSRRTRVEVVTEGILVRRLQGDPSLEGVGLVVLDEVHERSIHSDLALALLVDARSALCPELRVLAMSATLEADRLAPVLGGDTTPAPVVTSEGRTHPVELRWEPGRDRERLDAHVARVVADVVRREAGDVLVFLPGAADIRRAAGALGGGTLPPGVDVRPLFGALPVAEQDLALAPSPAGRRRVVLATDIAETSLTVAGVRVVVDAGRARVPLLDPRTGLTRLRTVTASQASADQRAGRAGRTEPGVAVRLWSEASHATRPAFATPEIAQVDLAALVLDLALWGASPDELRFLDPPPAPARAEAHALLRELGALDGDGRPTATGRAVARLPLHPRLARMVVDGARRHRGWEACLLAAALEERDVLRGRPGEVPVDAAERLRVLADRRASHPRADERSVRAAGRRARQIARRADVDPVDRVDPTACGPLLGLAYPDRLAQVRPGHRVRLRNGTGAALPAADPMAAEAWLAVAEVDTAPTRPGTPGAAADQGQVRIAAALDEADVVALGGAAVATTAEVVWDEGRDDLRARTERRLGALVLSSHDAPVAPGAATVAALVELVAARGVAALGWTEAARELQQRAVFAARAHPGEGWPDVTDNGLAADLEGWLAPRLARARGRRDLERVDVLDALRGLLAWPWLGRLDEVAPRTVAVASGRELRVDYSADAPAAHVRVQDLYGTTTHPTVDGGRVPLVLHLLSPAGRDVQVTADLPGFWAGSWADVRKDMAGRYPKHPWPDDPAAAAPPPPRRGGRPRRR
ncbi:ATP-dependent helicase HrpB [Iamia majanohamensis]|uniref:ATP-dependent helicase HrpB n=1 Tax=Iamia majanohamensis TaxID=467976 RepID=A0AAE9Y555_9ACTN|nr:ATP-dependent helicase HrpB [Iamia majanohamensis]WCO66860.1 ATP-dependent helicase HrpB [Iamia majanohamensis]